MSEVQINGRKISLANLIYIAVLLITVVFNYASKPSENRVREMIIDYSPNKSQLIELTGTVKAAKDQLDKLEKDLEKISDKLDRINTR